MERAACLFSAAEFVRRSVGHPLTAPARRAIDPEWQSAARLALAAIEISMAWAVGEILPLDQAVRFACGDGDWPCPGDKFPNRQIAALLPA